jgi:hypothetical protein
VYDTGASPPSYSRDFGIVSQDPVYQSSSSPAGPGVDHQAGGLVEHDQVVVLEEDIEPPLLGL